MKLSTLWCLIVTASLAWPAFSRGQTLPFALTGGSGSTAVRFELRLDGTILENGSGSSTLTNADLQASSAFIWYAPLGALRAESEDPETVSQLGIYSVAFGYGSTATGSYTFAEGHDCQASNLCSVAMGDGSYAAYNAQAIGQNNYSDGAWSNTLGVDNLATGGGSCAFGSANSASGTGALAIGYMTVSEGWSTAAFNAYTIAHAYCSTVFGQYNIGGGNANTWVATDPLFEIGNGTSSSSTSDALVVYKNGNATVQGTLAAHTGLRCAAGGDLSMGSFTAGTAP